MRQDRDTRRAPWWRLPILLLVAMTAFASRALLRGRERPTAAALPSRGAGGDAPDGAGAPRLEETREQVQWGVRLAVPAGVGLRLPRSRVWTLDVALPQGLMRRGRTIVRWLGTPWGQATLALVCSRAVSWSFALDGARGDWRSAFFAWDSGHYLSIAQDGYPFHGSEQWAFFPLYPALARTVAVGVVVSTVSLWLALRMLYSLASEHLSGDGARRAVWACALFPSSVYFSAYFTEGLWLALTIGALLAARRDRAWTAAVLGAAAALTRGGPAVALVVPLFLLCRRSVRTRLLAASGPLVGLGSWLLVAYVWTGDALAPQHAEVVWGRVYNGLFGAVGPAIDDAVSALTGANPSRWYFEAGWLRELELFTLIVLLVAAAWLLRRSLIAYGVYIVGFLAIDLSYFWSDHPLVSFTRYAGGLAPLYLYLGGRFKGGAARVVFGLEVVGLAVLSWRFGSGAWLA